MFFLKMDIPVGSRFGSLDWERVSISSSKLPNNYTDSRRSPDIQIGGVPSTSNNYVSKIKQKFGLFLLEELFGRIPVTKAREKLVLCLLRLSSTCSLYPKCF